MFDDDDEDRRGEGPPDRGDPVRGAGPAIKYSIAQMISVLIATAIKVANVEEGRTRLIDLTTAAFLAVHGSGMRLLEEAVARLGKDFARFEEQRDKLFLFLEQTSQWIPASQKNHGRSPDEHVETPYSGWQHRHQWEAAVILILIPFAAGASILTAQKNLMGTGLPVFLDAPWLAWSMAALAPLSGFAIKTMGSHLQNDVFRWFFTFALNVLAVISILLWVWLYAIQFTGLIPSPVTEGLFDEQTWWDESLGTAFTMVTLITEILVMAVLAHRLDKIAAFYAPNYWLENPEFVTLSQRLEQVEARMAAISAELEAKQAALAGYQGSLDTQIHLAVMAYDARRAQRDDPTL